MTVLVTGSSGHLGEALIRTLRAPAARRSASTSSPAVHRRDRLDRRPRLVARCMQGAEAVLHAATLHKPHVATHARAAFVEANVLGTLILLEEAVRAHVSAFVLTSTTSAFGDALKPPHGEPAAWIDEGVAPVPEEHLRRHQDRGRGSLPIVPPQRGPGVDRAEDLALLSGRGRRPAARAPYADDNPKANEFLFRRVAIEDVVDAHLARDGARAGHGLR